MKKLIASILVIVAFSTAGLAFEFNRTPAGLIKGLRISRVSNSAIKIGVGDGETMGSYWEVGATDTLNTTGYTLTGLAATTYGVYQYIYVDRSASSFPTVTLMNSTTAPAWSDDYMGWYSGEDRCIGAVWAKADGTLFSFYCSDDETYVGSVGTPVSGGTVSTDWSVLNTVNCGTYSPANMQELHVNASCYWNGTGAEWTYSRSGVRAENGFTVYDYGSRNNGVAASLRFARGVTKNVIWIANASSAGSNTAQVVVTGYKLER